MSIIIIMLVFELIWSHCPEICDHFRQPSQSTPVLHDCMFIYDSCYFQSLPFRRFPCVPHPVAPPSTGNCYNEQRNNRFNSCWFHTLFREAQLQYNSLVECDSLNLFNWKIFSFRYIRSSIISSIIRNYLLSLIFLVIYCIRYSLIHTFSALSELSIYSLIM